MIASCDDALFPWENCSLTPQRRAGRSGYQGRQESNEPFRVRPSSPRFCLYGDPASRPTENAREPPRPRLSAAVLSQTRRVVGVEIGVALSKSITRPARREQLVWQVRIEQQVSDYLRGSHEPLGETLGLVEHRQQSVRLGRPSGQVPE